MTIHTRIGKWIVTTGAMALLLAGCGASEPATPSGSDHAPGASAAETTPAETPKEATKVNFRLDFTWGSEHLGYILAQEKGFYKEAGLDVTMAEGQGSAIGATLLASGEADMGVIAGGEILAGISRGLPIQAVASVLRSSPASIIYNTDKVQVKNPKDLEGHSIAVDIATSNGKMWLAAAAKDGVDLSKVKQVNAGKAVVQALLSGDVVSIMGYDFNQGLQARAGGANVEFLSVAEMGIDVPDHAIAVNKAWSTSNGDAVKAFIEATKKGWKAVTEDKEAALDILLRDHPQLNRDMMSQKLDIFLDLVGPVDEFGTFDLAKWELLGKVYFEQGLLEKEVKIEGEALNTDYVEVNR